MNFSTKLLFLIPKWLIGNYECVRVSWAIQIYLLATWPFPNKKKNWTHIRNYDISWLLTEGSNNTGIITAWQEDKNKPGLAVVNM